VEIRKMWDRNPSTPLKIVACTATDTKAQRARCKDAGMDEFLTKPVSYDALKALLERLL